MAQFRERLALDLTDALTRDAEFATHFFERARMTVFKAETQRDDLALTLCQALERFRELLLEHGEAGCIRRNNRGIVFDKIAQLRVFLFADRRFKADRFLRDLLDLTNALRREAHLFSDLFGGWFATERLQELTLNAHELVDGLDHMNGNADGARLVCDSA
mgnify:CR=1 FL=1